MAVATIVPAPGKHAEAGGHGHGHGGAHGEGHGEGHGHSPPTGYMYHVTWVVCSVVLSLLRYVLCITAAVMIHDGHPTLTPYLSVGIGVQLFCSFLTCAWTSWRAKLGVMISGSACVRDTQQHKSASEQPSFRGAHIRGASGARSLCHTACSR